jgi:hypothetical protein
VLLEVGEFAGIEEGAMAHRAGFHPEGRLSRIYHSGHLHPVDGTKHSLLFVMHSGLPGGTRVDRLGPGPPLQQFMFQPVKPEAAAPDTTIHLSVFEANHFHSGLALGAFHWGDPYQEVSQASPGYP